MPGNVLGAIDCPLQLFGGLNTELSPPDLPEGVSPDCQDVAFLPGSVFTRPSLHKLYNQPLPNSVGVNYVRSFVQENGDPLTLFLGGDGRLYQEDTLNNPDTYSLFGTAPGGVLANSFTAFGKEFLTFHDGRHGQAIPLQYDAANLDRVSQDGPGANPIIASDLATQLTIQNVTQGLISAIGGMTSITQVGNLSTITFSTPHGMYAGQQISLDGVIDGGGASITNYNGSFIIASVPTATTLTFASFPNGIPNAVQGNCWVGSDVLIAAAPTGATQSGTTVTITTVTPHGLSAGQTVAIIGVVVSGYIGTFTVTSILNATQFTVTNATTGLAASGAGAATTMLSNLTTATPHGLNIGDPFIVSGYTGGGATWANGTWTVNSVLSPTAVTFIANSGRNPEPGTTSGSVSVGGQIVAGEHKFVVMFLTRNSYVTAPSPISSWTCGGNKQVNMTGIPLGPPNVVARIVAFTPSGGDNYFYIPITVDGGNTAILPDNVSTTATFNFSDNTLMSSIAIDVDGNNQFNQVSLAPPSGGFVYGDRTLWWGERNKVQNLVNMGFDGGSNQGVVLGWSVDTSGGQLIAGGAFGQAWQITGDGSSNQIGQIHQTTFQDQFGINILQPLTPYSFVCWGSVPTLIAGGNVVAKLTSAATSFTATATLPVGSLTTAGSFLTANFDQPTPVLIPSDMVLTICTQNTADGAVIVLDEMEIIPTAQPFADTRIRVSYVNNPEAFDDVTGLLIVGQSNGQPVRSVFTLRDNLYVVKSNSMYVTNDNGQEPSFWDISVVSNTIGALSARAVDVGDDWAVIAHRSGLYLFNGASPVKISQEIDSLWQRINWNFANTVWVKVDALTRRIYVGVPLDTATAPSNILVLDYRELNSGSDVQANGPIHTSYTGKMMATDLSRKWTIWNITANCADLIYRDTGIQELVLGGGDGLTLTGGFGNLYYLDPARYTDDDFGQINSYWTSYFFINHEMEQALQTGSHRKLYNYLTEFISGVGFISNTPIVDQLQNLRPTTSTRTLSLTPTRDIEWGLNVLGERTAFKVQPSPNLGPNLIADSDGSLGTWNISGTGLIYNAEGVGAIFPSGGWQFLGNGNPSIFTFAESQLINVIPGQTYTLSGFIDASAVSPATTPDSYPLWSVEDARLTTVYGSVSQTPGFNGQLIVTFTIPEDVTQVAVICDTNNCIVSNGGVLTFSNPQFQLGSVATPWQNQNTDSAFNLEKMVVSMRQDPWSPVAGSRF